MSLAGIFSISLSGVSAQAERLATTASNVANANTTGYRRQETEFSTLIGASLAQTRGNARVGAGVDAQARTRFAEQGVLERTGNETHIAIAGDGFLPVADADNPDNRETLLTRAGAFRLAADGRLVNEAGQALLAGDADGASLAGLAFARAEETITPDEGGPPARLASLSIDESGLAIARYENGDAREAFRIALVTLTNAEGLEEAGDTAFRIGAEAGAAQISRPGAGRAGLIEQGALEASTVDLGREFGALIEAQRAYAANSRALSLADALLERLVDTAR